MLAAIQRQRPGDAQALSIAHHHFACTRDMAADLHARAQACSPSHHTGSLYIRSELMQGLVLIMFLVLLDKMKVTRHDNMIHGIMHMV